MKEYQTKGDMLTKKEEETLKDMKIVQEMYARGITFQPIDIYKAHDMRFQIIDEKLMPSLATIDGLGEKAALAVVEEANKTAFLSIDDFRTRTKVSKTVIAFMSELGLLDTLPQSNQLSFFH